MAFRFCDSMIHQYWSQGYVVFKGVIPPSLLRDMRPEADKARAKAREVLGPQAQRLQPIVKYPETINIKPFEEYAKLPALVDAINRLLGPFVGPVGPATMSVMGILVEPSERPRHHGWHRDMVCDVPLAEQKTPDRVKWVAERWHKPWCLNQVNCAIYPDSCLWYVPGSHARMHDLPGEEQGFCYYKEKNPFDEIEGSHPELERIFLDACLNFPGATRIHLDPGDYMVYRNSGWHTGLYNTHTPRATIHDSISYGPVN